MGILSCHIPAGPLVGWPTRPISYVACRLQEQRQRPGQILASSGRSCKFHWARRKKRHIKNVKHISCRLVTGTGAGAGAGAGRGRVSNSSQDMDRTASLTSTATATTKSATSAPGSLRLWAWHINICMHATATTSCKKAMHTIYILDKGQSPLIPTPDSGRASSKCPTHASTVSSCQPNVPPTHRQGLGKNFAAEFNPIINGILLTSGIKLNVVISRVQRNYQAAVYHTHSNTHTHSSRQWQLHAVGAGGL